MKIVEKREVWKSSEYEEIDSLISKLIPLVNWFIEREKKNMDRAELGLTKDTRNGLENLSRRVNIYGVEER